MAAVVAAVMLAVAGWFIYSDNFSTEAHAKHDCTTAWKTAAEDHDAMAYLFDENFEASEKVMREWLLDANELRRVLTGHGNCFKPETIKYASKESLYPPENIDVGELSASIRCVTAGNRSDCNPPSTEFAVPIPMLPLAPTPMNSRPEISNSPTAICFDGTYSYSAHHQGTCSYHGGVRQWLR